MEFKASMVTMPDTFLKWIGIPISLFQLESEPWSPASPPEAYDCPAKPTIDF